MALTQITEYQVQYSSNKSQPRIFLKNGTTYIAQLLFMADGSTLPVDGVLGGQVVLYYHLEDFQNVFRLLSGEKVVYLLYAGSGPGFENGIQTSPDPLGNLP
jgi:hypothetical protein